MRTFIKVLQCFDSLNPVKIKRPYIHYILFKINNPNVDIFLICPQGEIKFGRGNCFLFVG